MRFRSLRIDYRAEAIEVLREERQLRQQRKQERRRDNDGNKRCDDSSISISHQSRPRKKRRVIRIFHEALEPKPEQRWHKPEQERDRNDNKKEAVLRLPFWISTQVNNDSDKDSLATSDIDNLSIKNNQKEDRPYVVGTGNTYATSITAATSIGKSHYPHPVQHKINYRIFYNTPWLLSLVSSIRRQANRRRIASYPAGDDDDNRRSYLYPRHRCRRSMEYESLTNESFFNFYRRIQQWTIDRSILLTSYERNTKLFDKKLSIRSRLHTFCERHSTRPGSSSSSCRYSGAILLPPNINNALKNGSHAYTIGSKRPRWEDWKQELGVVTTFRNTIAGSETLDGVSVPGEDNCDGGNLCSNWRYLNSRREQNPLVTKMNSSSPLLPSPPHPSPELWKTAMMTVQAICTYQKQVLQQKHALHRREESESPNTHAAFSEAEGTRHRTPLIHKVPASTGSENISAREQTTLRLSPNGNRGRRGECKQQLQNTMVQWKQIDRTDCTINDEKRSPSPLGKWEEQITTPTATVAPTIATKWPFDNSILFLSAPNWQKENVVFGDRNCHEEEKKTREPAVALNFSDDVEYIDSDDYEQGNGKNSKPNAAIEGLLDEKPLVMGEKYTERRPRTSSSEHYQGFTNNSTTENSCIACNGDEKEELSNIQEHHHTVKAKEKELTLLQRFGLVAENNIGGNYSATKNETTIARKPSPKHNTAVDDRINDDADNNANAHCQTPRCNKDMEIPPSDFNDDETSPFEFPVCSDQYEEEDDRDENIASSKRGRLEHHSSSPTLERTSRRDPEIKNRQKRRKKRRRTKEEKKMLRKEKRAEKRRNKGEKNSKPQHKHMRQDVAKKSSEKLGKNGLMKANKREDSEIEIEELETPKKLEDITPEQITARQRNPEHVLDGTNLYKDNNFTSPLRTKTQFSDLQGATGKNSKLFRTPQMGLNGDNSDKDITGDASNDPFYVSPEEIEHITESCDINDRMGISNSDITEVAANNNSPVRVLCSETFFENFGEVIAELARGIFDGIQSMENMPIHFTDTYLMDTCGVDIETPFRGAIVVSTLSQIQTSGPNGLLQNFLPKIVELVSTSRYRHITIFLCIDTKLDTDTSQDILRLQTAFLCDAEYSAERTTTSIQLTSRACLAACIAKNIVWNRSRFDSNSHFSAMSKMDHWLSDQRACQRLKFLMNIIPTLSVTGALHWIESRQSPTRPSTQTESEDDKSMAWFQQCFARVEEESNYLKSLLPSSKHPKEMMQLHDFISPYVALQLVTVVGARLNTTNYF
ncbi:unnamed protein product [Pseudo-nitzschia multistriata]|uniref:Uncharacterized protein n=1 Tax=Pseudo-nitzschia multistriata TaxID=183589 RepID=A0A448YVK8_9STRA|nr:unnamed protein product [Pseudo-nitzschia multistriata]